ncbi:hypothetical protein D3C84_685640 [compost metagenome]
MELTNIDEFNLMTGKVFARLYESFPIPAYLSPTELGIPVSKGGEYDPETGTTIGEEPPTCGELIFSHSVQWLIETGYLTCGSLPAGCMPSLRTHFPHARLTAKGLETLNAVPSNLKSESLGRQIASASKSGSLELLRMAVAEALGIGAKVFGRYIGADT